MFVLIMQVLRLRSVADSLLDPRIGCQDSKILVNKHISLSALPRISEVCQNFLCRRFWIFCEVEVCGTMSDTDTLGLRNQGDRNLWDEPDPRIKWALDLFDDQVRREIRQTWGLVYCFCKICCLQTFCLLKQLQKCKTMQNVSCVQQTLR